MSKTKKKTVSMSFEALLSYIINTNYRCFSGVSGLFISVVSLILLLLGFNSLSRSGKILLLLVGLTFTVINPIVLTFKAFKQYKLSPSYRKPLSYTFTNDGIEVSLGEQSQLVKWDMICRLMMTKSMIAIYTSRLHAFVIPLKELGDDKGNIVTSVVQFTAEYKPQLSKNLKEYKSGKGYSG